MHTSRCVTQRTYVHRRGYVIIFIFLPLSLCPSSSLVSSLFLPACCFSDFPPSFFSFLYLFFSFFLFSVTVIPFFTSTESSCCFDGEFFRPIFPSSYLSFLFFSVLCLLLVLGRFCGFNFKLRNISVGDIRHFFTTLTLLLASVRSLNDEKFDPHSSLVIALHFINTCT